MQARYRRISRRLGVAFVAGCVLVLVAVVVIGDRTRVAGVEVTGAGIFKTWVVVGLILAGGGFGLEGLAQMSKDRKEASYGMVLIQAAITLVAVCLVLSMAAHAVNW